LIELIVVLSVTAILMTVLFEVLAIGKQKVRETGCLANLRQIGAAGSMYSADNNGMLISAHEYGPGYKENVTDVAWKFQIGRYVYPNSGVGYIWEGSGQKGDEVYLCSDSKLHEDLWTETFECPEAPHYQDEDGNTYESITEWKRGGYGHSELGEHFKYVNTKGATVNGIAPVKVTAVEMPSETILIGDSLTQNLYSPKPHVLYKPTVSFMKTRLYQVHKLGVNLLWVDGRVSWISNIALRNRPAEENPLGTYDYFFKMKK